MVRGGSKRGTRTPELGYPKTCASSCEFCAGSVLKDIESVIVRQRVRDAGSSQSMS
jgi:hypothetical protein